MAKIKVLSHSWTEITEEANPDDDWSADSTSTYWSFNGIKVVSEKDYFDLVTAFEPKKRETYYLVLVVYHSGDSFHHADNEYVEYIDLYQDINNAEQAAEEIRQHDSAYDRRGHEETYKLMVTMANGKRKHHYASWHGYFNGVGSIQVVSVSL